MIDLDRFPIDVTEHITKFRDFLCICWPSIDSLMDDHDWDNDGGFFSDWLAVNWELLVERELLCGKGFLKPFGITHLDSRVIFPNQKPTHAVYAKSNNLLFDMRKPPVSLPTDQKLRLFSFGSSKKNFGLHPPFDVAAVFADISKKYFYVLFKELQFYIDSIE
ncbi:MAG: hypothetical protein JWO53_485 [Chlamydiia bacterium]|nr:hypothetical protein [Chlamydiia bacterium]